MPIRTNDTTPEQRERWAARRALVGRRIRVLREERGLSQTALALEAGLSRNMIIGVEWGRRSLAFERLWDIAAVLECDIEVITAETPPSK